jgi:hypothetical protein
LGRRNLTVEQKSYLRGKRYNLEKNQGNRTDLTSGTSCQKSETTAQKLATEYQVAEKTIRQDGHFAEAVDTLEEAVRHDIREAVLTRQERGKQQATKKQVTHAAQLVQADTVKPLP